MAARQALEENQSRQNAGVNGMISTNSSGRPASIAIVQTQISVRLDAVEQADRNQAIDIDRARSAGVRTQEEVIAPAQYDGADGSLGSVVVQLDPTVVDESCQRRPARQRALDGLRQLGPQMTEGRAEARIAFADAATCIFRRSASRPPVSFRPS